MTEERDTLGDNRTDSEDWQFYDNPPLRINMEIKDMKLRKFEHFSHDLYQHGLHSSEILAASSSCHSRHRSTDTVLDGVYCSKSASSEDPAL
jgi:hypothetical protein